MEYWPAWAASGLISALLPGLWGCAGAEGAGGSTLMQEAEAVAVQSAEFPWRLCLACI